MFNPNKGPFKRELDLIQQKGSLVRLRKWGVWIHANGKDIQASRVLKVHRVRDYSTDYAERVAITFEVTQAQHIYDILPFEDKLEATVKYTNHKKSEEWGNPRVGSPVSYRYKAKLFENDDKSISSNNPAVTDRSVLERSNLVSVTIQLLDAGLETLRQQRVSGTFRNTTGIELISTLLTKYSAEATNDADVRIKGVTVAPGASDVVREQIVLGPRTKLYEIPNIVNEMSGGIYSTGFSYFMQDRNWYIYPPYDLERFDKLQKNLIIVNLPKNRLPDIEKVTYDTPTQTVILSTLDSQIYDGREKADMNKGNGVTFVDANNMMEFGNVTGNKFLVNAAENVNELLVTERSDGITNVNPSDSIITANKNIELSKLAATKGLYMIIVWEGGDESLIYPGEPVKVLYLEQDKAKSAVGTVVGTETIEQVVNHDFSNSLTKPYVAITVFVKPQE